MTAFWSILVTIESLYSLLIISFAISWLKLKPFNLSGSQKPKSISISIIVAMRNEVDNIPKLISNFSQLNTDYCSPEVILIDDHSTDHTFKIAKELSIQYSWIKVLKLNEGTGKKAALKSGANSATGELLLFTDADCLIPKNWADSYAAFYNKHNKPDLIIGLVDMETQSWWQDIFRFEFLSLILSGAAAQKLGMPVFCNGANLAVRASIYQMYTPDYNIASGDDVFLLHDVKHRKGNIKLLKSGDNLVKTRAVKSLHQFFNQRARWASKARAYTDVQTILLALLVLLSNIVLLISITSLMTKPALIIIAVKTLTDLTLFISGRDFYSYGNSILFYPLIALLYPIYIIISLALSIKKPFLWKGRRL